MSRTRVTVESGDWAPALAKEEGGGGAESAAAACGLASAAADVTGGSSSGADLVETVRGAVLGDGCEFEGPFGPRPVVYADHTASGRALSFIESYVQTHVLPLYGNTHTTTSVTGRQSTLFRTEAREIVHRSVNGGARDVVLFVGSGVTAAINKVVHLLGLQAPGALHGAAAAAPGGAAAAEEVLARWRRTHSVDAYTYHNLSAKPDPNDIAARTGYCAAAQDDQAPAPHGKAGAGAGEAGAASAGKRGRAMAVVYVGPWEHHSNLLPWRESLAEVVQIAEDGDTGGIDLAMLERHLKQEVTAADGGGRLLIGSFSAGSNVSGAVADIGAVTSLLHRYGALSFWDFAAAGPHVAVNMNPSGPGAINSLDGAFLSPHKYVGGPQCPGVLVLKRHVFDLQVRRRRPWRPFRRACSDCDLPMCDVCSCHEPLRRRHGIRG
jgi:hypothetical protein